MYRQHRVDTPTVATSLLYTPYTLAYMQQTQSPKWSLSPFSQLVNWLIWGLMEEPLIILWYFTTNSQIPGSNPSILLDNKWTGLWFYFLNEVCLLSLSLSSYFQTEGGREREERERRGSDHPECIQVLHH